MITRTFFIILFAYFADLASIKADWLQWRGPMGQGIADQSKVPIEWSETKNIAWRAQLPGRGWSSPLIVGNQVWVTTAHETIASEEQSKERLKANTGSQPLIVLSELRIHAICIDKETGEIIKDIEVLRKKDPQWIHKTNSYASPTPIIEDGRMYIQKGSYGSACLDLESGKVMWQNQDLWVMHENGPGGSPLIWHDLLIFHMDGSDKQFIVAIDKNTGKVVWKTKRSGKMHDNPQLKKAYGTPVIVSLQGRDVVVSPAANWLYGYDPVTGDELWKLEYGTLGFSIVPKPVIGNGMIYIGTSYMRPQMLGIDVSKPQPRIAWSCKRSVPAISSPLLIGEELYFVSDSGGMVTCLDAKTGVERWRERIGGNHGSSPTFVGGRILFHSKEGETVALKPGREFKILARNKLDGEHHASAAISDNSIFLRTEKALYKISE